MGLAGEIGEGPTVSRGSPTSRSGPTFSPDDSALFISVQHPGEGGYSEGQINTWSFNRDGVIPRPSVVVVTRRDDPTAPIVG